MTKKTEVRQESGKCALCGGKVRYGSIGLWDGYKSDLESIGGVLYMEGVSAVYKDSGRDVPLCPACILKEMQGMARYGLAQLAAEGCILKIVRNTLSVHSRTFSDKGTYIRIKDGKHPVFKVTFENGYHSVCWNGIVLGCSKSMDGLLKDVSRTLVFLWREYAEAKSSNMTRSALRIRNLMLAYFEEVKKKKKEP